MSEWIEHDGACRPVSVGTIVDIKRRGGLVNFQYPVGIYKPGIDGNQDFSRPVDGRGGSSWIWGSCLPQYRYLEIIAYRLHEDQVEKDRLSARQEMFQGWIRSVTPDGPEQPRKAPSKAPAKVGAK